MYPQRIRFLAQLVCLKKIKKCSQSGGPLVDTIGTTASKIIVPTPLKSGNPNPEFQKARSITVRSVRSCPFYSRPPGGQTKNLRTERDQPVTPTVMVNDLMRRRHWQLKGVSRKNQNLKSVFRGATPPNWGRGRTFFWGEVGHCRGNIGSKRRNFRTTGSANRAYPVLPFCWENGTL
jgi:hypothetical protein